MKNVLLFLCNVLSFIFALFASYYINVKGIDGKNIGQISDKYHTLVTPADYAFSIWGLIYLFLFGFLIYQGYQLWRKKDAQLVQKISVFFIISSLANGAWTYIWLKEYTFLSVLVMLTLLGSLVILNKRLNNTISKSIGYKVLVAFPLGIYVGWVILATVTNISAYLVSVGFNGELLPPSVWAILILLTATIIYVFLLLKKKWWQTSIIGIWGFVAIVIAQWDNHDQVVWTAGLAVIVLIVLLIKMIFTKSYRQSS